MSRRAIPAILLAAVVVLGSTGETAGLPKPAAGHDPASRCRGTHWLAVWGSSPSEADRGATLAGYTIRTIVTPLGSGTPMRVRLSNRFGDEPLVIASAFAGVQRSGPSVRRVTNRRLRFGGDRGVSIAPGAEVVSDPVALRVRPFRRLAISFFVAAGSSAHPTQHLTALQTTYIARASAGDVSGVAGGGGFEGPGTLRLSARPIVTGIDARAPRGEGAVVAFGDSLTDGFQAPGEGIDADARYPDFLARRFAASVEGAHSVVNAGISGNALLTAYIGPFGPSGLTRLHPDVIAQRGVTDAIVLIGRNDFGISEPPEVIAALKVLIGRLHEHRINVLLGTFSPPASAPLPADGGAEANGDRHVVNRWIRHQRLADAVVDFDRAVRDPEDHDSLLPAFASGDSPHLSAAGYREMARAIDLDDLSGSRCGLS